MIFETGPLYLSTNTPYGVCNCRFLSLIIFLFLIVSLLPSKPISGGRTEASYVTNGRPWDYVSARDQKAPTGFRHPPHTVRQGLQIPETGAGCAVRLFN